jgi:hypothetical protein
MSNVLDADLMVTLSAEGGVSLLYPSKHLTGVQMYKFIDGSAEN